MKDPLFELHLIYFHSFPRCDSTICVLFIVYIYTVNYNLFRHIQEHMMNTSNSPWTIPASTEVRQRHKFPFVGPLEGQSAGGVGLLDESVGGYRWRFRRHPLWELTCPIWRWLEKWVSFSTGVSFLEGICKRDFHHMFTNFFSNWVAQPPPRYGWDLDFSLEFHFKTMEDLI